MSSIRVTLGVCISLMAILLVSSAFGQEMPGNRPSIILSKGMTIHRIDGPTTLPRTFSEIADNTRITPVPAGKLLLRFDDQMLDSAEGRRLLVLTEDGVWGYVRADNGLFEAEARLREIHESRDIRHVILVRDQLADLPALTPVHFGRGEIYTTRSSPDDSDTEIILTEDKRRDILKQNPAMTSADVPATATLPTGALATIDVIKALPKDLPFERRRRTTPAEYRTIYGSWRKAIPEPKVNSYKPCGQLEERSRSKSDGLNLKAGGSLDSTISWWEWLKAQLHLSAELAVKSESMFKEILKTSDDIDVLIKAWSINTDHEKSNLFRLLRYTDCKNRQTWYTAQSDEFGLKDFRIEKPDLDSVNVEYQPTSGIVLVSCYADYLGLLHQISTKWDLSEQDTGFLLSRISRLRDWRAFFSQKCT